MNKITILEEREPSNDETETEEFFGFFVIHSNQGEAKGLVRIRIRIMLSSLKGFVVDRIVFCPGPFREEGEEEGPSAETEAVENVQEN
jgi:hypothetical protein